METCSRCQRRVDRLHPVPPGVLTRDLLDAVGDPDSPSELELCGDCVNELLEGTAST